MTAIDVLILITTIALVALIVPAFLKNQARAARVNCVNHLKQIGLAFRMWSNDNKDGFPWRVSIKDGGTMELVTNGNILPIFLIATNELSSPKILKCPDDPGRVSATSFDKNFSTNNICYFLGLDADETKPMTILSGDRSLSTNGIMQSGILTIRPPTNIKWALGIHGGFGNIALGDGSAQQITGSSLSNHFATKISAPAGFILP